MSDEITQWEYKEESIYQGVEKINKLGKEGWEAIGSIGNSTEFLLKRPMQKQKSTIPDYLRCH